MSRYSKRFLGLSYSRILYLPAQRGEVAAIMSDLSGHVTVLGAWSHQQTHDSLPNRAVGLAAALWSQMRCAACWGSYDADRHAPIPSNEHPTLTVNPIPLSTVPRALKLGKLYSADGEIIHDLLFLIQQIVCTDAGKEVS